MPKLSEEPEGQLGLVEIDDADEREIKKRDADAEGHYQAGGEKQQSQPKVGAEVESVVSHTNDGDYGGSQDDTDQVLIQLDE